MINTCCFWCLSLCPIAEELRVICLEICDSHVELMVANLILHLHIKGFQQGLYGKNSYSVKEQYREASVGSYVRNMEITTKELTNDKTTTTTQLNIAIRNTQKRFMSFSYLHIVMYLLSQWDRLLNINLQVARCGQESQEKCPTAIQNNFPLQKHL